MNGLSGFAELRADMNFLAKDAQGETQTDVVSGRHGSDREVGSQQRLDPSDRALRGLNLGPTGIERRGSERQGGVGSAEWIAHPILQTGCPAPAFGTEAGHEKTAPKQPYPFTVAPLARGAA